MNSITWYGVSTAIVMITSMVWFLLTNINQWHPETIISILFIFGGGVSTFYLITVVINLSTPIECDECGRELAEWESNWGRKWIR